MIRIGIVQNYAFSATQAAQPEAKVVSRMSCEWMFTQEPQAVDKSVDNALCGAKAVETYSLRDFVHVSAAPRRELDAWHVALRAASESLAGCAFDLIGQCAKIVVGLQCRIAAFGKIAVSLVDGSADGRKFFRPY